MATQTSPRPTSRLMAFYQSSVGRKLITGITGLGLVLFVLGHMVGNLGYFSPDPDAYNAYAAFLVGLGPLLYLVEAILLVFFVFHAVLGIQIYLGKKRARPAGYSRYQSAGNPSRQTISSRTMIWTGLILLAFLVLHLISFKYGPSIEEGYVTTVGGEQIRDLKRLVTERFQNPLYAFGYPAVMLLLGFHLRHGIWSAFQSLGAMKPSLTPVVYTIGTVLAILIAVGFLILPLYIYFAVDPVVAPAATL